MTMVEMAMVMMIVMMMMTAMMAQGVADAPESFFTPFNVRTFPVLSGYVIHATRSHSEQATEAPEQLGQAGRPQIDKGCTWAGWTSIHYKCGDKGGESDGPPRLMVDRGGERRLSRRA